VYAIIDVRTKGKSRSISNTFLSGEKRGFTRRDRGKFLLCDRERRVGGEKKTFGRLGLVL
jgi:hypothetical protein